MPKQTRLGDDALIYQPRNKQTEKEKLRDMSFKDKLSYIGEYYKLHILGIFLVIAIIIYIIYSITHPKPTTQFYAAMINNAVNEDVLNNYKADFSEKLELNTKKENVLFNTNFIFNDDDQMSLSMKQALAAYITTKEVDVIIAPEADFYEYATNGYFSELSDQLPTDIYSSLTDQFYMTGTINDTDKKAYGIYLNNTKLYKDNNLSTQRYVLGILANTTHTENTIEFIRYLFNEK